MAGVIYPTSVFWLKFNQTWYVPPSTFRALMCLVRLSLQPSVSWSDLTSSHSISVIRAELVNTKYVWSNIPTSYPSPSLSLRCNQNLPLRKMCPCLQCYPFCIRHDQWILKVTSTVVLCVEEFLEGIIVEIIDLQHFSYSIGLLSSLKRLLIRGESNTGWVLWTQAHEYENPMRRHFCYVLVYLLVVVSASKNDEYYMIQLKGWKLWSSQSQQGSFHWPRHFHLRKCVSPWEQYESLH